MLVFLLQVAVLLLMALLLGRLAVRFRMPAIVGELFAGVILGPSVFQNVAPQVAGWLFPADPEQFHMLDAIGQFGVLLLVGVAGAHLDLRLVRRRRGAAMKIGGFGLIIPLGFGVATGLLLPRSIFGTDVDPVVFAMFLGIAMGVSAIPVIAKTFMDMNLLHRNISQITLTAAMLDGAFCWLLLSVASDMATRGVRVGNLLLSLAYLAAVVLLAAVVGRPLVAKVFQLAGRSEEPTPTLMTATILIIGCAAGTHALGLEAVVGAFIAGILISEYGKPDPARLAPLRTVVVSVLAPIFLATAGLRMDLTALTRIDVLGAALLILAIAIVGKFVGAYIGARTSRLSNWEALALGAGLNVRGAVEIIIAMVGLRLGVFNTATYTIIVLVAVVTSLMAPPILRVAMARVEPTEEEQVRQREHALA
jgi:Kef-type K+ transport system membrane component KefB